MNKPVSVRAISAEETRPLRHDILRLHQSYDACIYPGDDADSTLHVGAFEGDELVGVASFIREAPPDSNEERACRLRGMAVKPKARRKGHGQRIV